MSHAKWFSIRSALILAILMEPGCRLSDPVFYFKDLRADDPHADDRSLIVGSVEVDVFPVGVVESVTFATGPGAQIEAQYNSFRGGLFRVFRNRKLKSGNFLIQLPPGEYTLLEIRSSAGVFGSDQVWRTSEEKGSALKLIVTRPRIIDIGHIKVQQTPGEITYEISHVEKSNPERDAIFAKAIEGTSWAALNSTP